MRKYYKDALYIAAEKMFESEIVDTQMFDLLIGEDKDFRDRKEWIEARVTELLEEAELERDAG